MLKFSKLVLACAFFIAALLSGCALQAVQMYDGNAKTSSEQAVLASQGLYVEKRLALTVVAINGKEVPKNRTADYLLLPGTHVVTLDAYHDQKVEGLLLTWKRAMIDVKLNAKAGHSYMPQAEIQGDTFEPSFLDLGTSFQRGCMPLRVAFPGRSDIPVPASCPNLTDFKAAAP